MKTITAAALLQKEFTAKTLIMGDWLTSNSLNMVYSWRGLGKSLFCMALGYHVAGGQSFLGWAPRPFKRVLYIDGELGGAMLQSRIRDLVNSFEFDIPDDGISITSLEEHGGLIPNLGDPIERDIYTKMMEPYDVVIIDNLSSCIRAIPRKDKLTVWNEVRDWMLRERDKGKCIIYVHHAGKNGSQRWFSDVEDPLDISIKLSKHPHWTQHGSPKLVLEFEKTRNFVGDDAAEKYIQVLKLKDGASRWLWEHYDKSKPVKDAFKVGW